MNTGVVNIASMSMDLLMLTLQSCGEDYRMKFAITLQGIKRLLALMSQFNSESDDMAEDEDLLSIVQGCLDALALLVVQTSSTENADIFMASGGY